MTFELYKYLVHLIIVNPFTGITLFLTFSDLVEKCISTDCCNDIVVGTVDSTRGRPEKKTIIKKNWLTCQPLRVDSASECKKLQFYHIVFFI